jgi:hypothetical protein
MCIETRAHVHRNPCLMRVVDYSDKRAFCRRSGPGQEAFGNEPFRLGEKVFSRTTRSCQGSVVIDCGEATLDSENRSEMIRRRGKAA